MPKITIEIEVTEEQAETLVQREAMILFVNEEEKAHMKAVIQGLHVFFTRLTEVLSRFEGPVEADKNGALRMAETLERLRLPSCEGLGLVEMVWLFFNSAFLAKPKTSNSEQPGTKERVLQ